MRYLTTCCLGFFVSSLLVFPGCDSNEPKQVIEPTQEFADIYRADAEKNLKAMEEDEANN